MTDIETGAEVVTSEGRVLGRVKRVEASAFQLDVPRQFDYWLESSLVKNSSATRVELLIGESDVVSYRMDRPHDNTAFQQAGEDPQVINASVQRQVR